MGFILDKALVRPFLGAGSSLEAAHWDDERRWR
jgi:hypothetical protein